jgi:hypothetical protein
MSKTDIGRSVDRARRVFNLGLGLHIGSWCLAGWMAAAGALVLVVKVAGVLTWLEPWHVLMTGVPFAAAAAIAAFVRRYDHSTVAAWLDLKGECGGAVISSVERDGVTGEPPAIRPGVRGLPIVKRTVLPAVLLAASLVVPWVPRTITEASSTAIVQKARIVDERIEMARKMELIDERETLKLREGLVKAKANASSSPESAVEAVDEVQRKLEKKILEAAEEQRQAMQAAHDLHENAASGNTAKAGSSLEKALQQLGDPNDLPPELRKALDEMRDKLGGEMSGAGSKMDPKALEDLGKMLEQAHGKKLESLGKASDLMVDMESLQALGVLQGDCGCEGRDQGQGQGQPGQGGITRGRGDAPLIFGDESKKSGARFKPAPLEPGGSFVPAMFTSSGVVGGGTTPPEEFQPPGRVGAEIESGEGGSMIGSQLGPYHSEVVSNYFDTQGETQ